MLRSNVQGHVFWECDGFGMSERAAASSDEIAEFTGAEPSIRLAEILDGVSEVVGPLLNDIGRQIHHDFDW